MWTAACKLNPTTAAPNNAKNTPGPTLPSMTVMFHGNRIVPLLSRCCGKARNRRYPSTIARPPIRTARMRSTARSIIGSIVSS
jgi:hypothetical protein